MFASIMLALLPLIVFVLLVLTARTRNTGSRESILLAATAWGVIVVIITEALSAVSALGRTSIACAWGLFAFGALIAYRRFARAGVAAAHEEAKPEHTDSRSVAQSGLAAILVIWGLVGLTALLAPPNTWDAMQYHMPRIVHWLHNHSVAFYPVNEVRELNMPPWAEFAMLQFHALMGGDWLDNLVQWFSMGLCALSVSLIARELGADSRGQTLAALLSATIPEGILQASGAKNDYAVAAWICASAYFLLTMEKRPGLRSAVPLGAAVGLAVLTKGTAEIFIVGLGFLLLLWSRKALAQSLRFAPVVAIIALSLNIPHFKRNIELFGSPFGPTAYSPSGEFKLSNDAFTPPIIVSNILRNLAFQVEGPSAAVNRTLENSIIAVLKVMGEDINDPRATFDYTSFGMAERNRHEAYAGNPLHLALFLLAAGILAFRWFQDRDRRAAIFALAVIAGFVLFCAYLKWQPWNTRLLLPAFVLSAAAAGSVLATTLPAALEGALLIALAIFAGPALLENVNRPLTYAGGLNVFNASRVDQLFAEVPAIRQSYEQAARFANAQNCSNIGIDTRPYGSIPAFEYAFMVLLGDIDGSKNIHEVEISTVSKRYGSNDPAPCMVICPVCAGAHERAAALEARGMTLTAFGNVGIFTRDPILQSPTSSPRPTGSPAAQAPPPAPFAQPGDELVFGDWNGDGRIKVGAFRKGLWVLSVSDDPASVNDNVIRGHFGSPGDVPVVGDWDGKGKTKVGIFRNGLWILDLSGTAEFNAATARRLQLGLAGDAPVVGDWNGDGKTKIGVFRKGHWILDFNGENGKMATLHEGNFGLPDDLPVVGDWAGEHKDNIGIFRKGLWQLDLSGTANWPAKVIQGSFGLAGDKPIVGDWDNSGRSKIGIVRSGCWQVDLSGTANWKPSTTALGCSEIPGPEPRKRRVTAASK